MPPKNREKENNQHIQVAVRCRPINAQEKRSGSYNVVDLVPDKKEVHARERLIATAGTKSYSYDHVFGPSSSQMDVYKTMVSPILNEVIMGYNCTIFAYGQTGTGKTHTMEGGKADGEGIRWDLDPEAGIIPRAMSNLFTLLNSQDCEFSLRVSYLEIYNEELIDLLGADSVDNPRLKIYEDSSRKGSCVIQGLEEAVVYNRSEVHQILQKGAAKRQTAATLMNAHSSRSHSLFMVTIHMKENSIDGEELLKTGKLNLVDLAGSECIGRSGAVDKRAREAGNINQSLLTLGRVITALVEHAPHVPYRESKLTRLLQDSLGGKTKTSIIATISPASCCLEETLSTLDYAFRAKNITNKPEINQKLSKKAHLKELGDEIERLRRDLQAARDKNGIFLAEENYNSMQTTILQQRDEIKDLDERLTQVQDDLTKTSELFSLTKEELADTAQKLEETQDMLAMTRTTLQVTRKDRDEQKFLVRKHVETEEELFTQASELLTTSNVATGHIAGLHEKLDRKRKVEDDNASAKESFKLRFEKNIKNMEHRLQGYTGKHLENIANTKKNIGIFMEDKSARLAENKQQLEQFSASVSQNTAQLKSLMDTAVSDHLQWSTETKATAQLTKESSILMVDTFRETFTSEVQKLTQTLAHISAQQEALKLALNSQLNDMQKGIESLVSQQLMSLNQQRHLVNEYCEKQMSGLTAHSEEVTSLTGQHTQHVQAVADKLVGIINDLVSSQRSHASHINDKSEMREAKSLADKFKTNTNSHMRETEEDMRSASTQLITCCARDTQRDQSVITDLEKHLIEAGEIRKTMTSHVASHADKAVQHATDEEMKVTASLEQLNTSVTQHQHHLNQHADGMAESHDATISDMDDRLTAQYDDTMTHQSHQEERLGEAHTLLTDWSVDCNEQLTSRHEEVMRFINEETTTDVPTGQTPKRQDYSYPQQLVRTGRHSLLLDTFRLDYSQDDSDITDLNLCNGTDSKQTSRGGDVCEEEDMSGNISSDSALSTASTLSSACSMEKLTEGKENKAMGPPPPKIPTQKKKYGTPDLSSKGKKFINRANKAGDRNRTRVPLRSSNE